MATVRLSLIGLYNYDSTIFDGLSLPDGIDREVFINTLLLNYGEFGVLYSDLDFMRFFIAHWSKKWYDSFGRIYRGLTEEYNPIHNFDRFEEYSDNDSRKLDSSGNANSTLRSTNTIESDVNSGERSESKVSAYNSDVYQPDSSTDSTTSQTSRSNSASDQGETNTDSKSETENRDFKHTGHLYGNIGVTKSQDMIKDEINLRSNYNIYDIMCELFKRECLIMIY